MTQLVKLLGDQVGFKVAGAVTIVVAGIIGAILTLVDLDSEIVQGIYNGVIAVGGITALQNLGSIVKIGDSGDEPK